MDYTVVKPLTEWTDFLSGESVGGWAQIWKLQWLLSGYKNHQEWSLSSVIQWARSVLWQHLERLTAPTGPVTLVPSFFSRSSSTALGTLQTDPALEAPFVSPHALPKFNVLTIHANNRNFSLPRPLFGFPWLCMQSPTWYLGYLT